MPMKQTISTLAIIAIITGCSESQPIVSKQTSTNSKQGNQSVMLLAEEKGDPINNIDPTGTSGDSMAMTTKAAISDAAYAAKVSQTRSRSATSGTVTPASTGETQVVQHIDYRAGVIHAYSAFEYQLGQRTRRLRYITPGADGTWFNGDDEIGSYVEFSALKNGIQTNSILYTGAGPDLVWLTEDDLVRFYRNDVLDSAGNVIGNAAYVKPGIDAVWFTSDDELRWTTAQTTNANGDEEWIQYSDPGADGDWFTNEDNLVGHFSTQTFNTQGQPEQHTFYRNPGPDLTRFTADDAVSYYHQYFYNAQNLLNQVILFHGGPGPDNIYFSADDRIANCSEISQNADGSENQTVSFRPGADATCFTADDEIRLYHVHIYDSTQHLVGSKTFNDPGADGQWFNDDDIIANENTFDLVP